MSATFLSDRKKIDIWQLIDQKRKKKKRQCILLLPSEMKKTNYYV